MEAPEHLGDLAVARHRVRDARGPDHARVRGDEQDRGGEDADVDLEHAEHATREPEVLHEPEDRIVGVPALLRRQREQRRQLAVDHLHRQRRQRHERQRQVDREDGARDELVGVGNAPRRLARLLGQVGDGLHPRVGEHRDRHREREVRPGRRDAPVDVVDEDRGAEDEEHAEQHEEHLRREVEHREHDRELRRLLDADDVERDEDHDHDGAADDVPRIRLQRLPEDREVVRHEERRRRHRDDVDEHLGPRGAEADHLVERVAGEARRAARLRVEDGALRVGGRRHREHDPRDQEDERRQPERVDGGEAERVVDRRADVAVGGREEGRCPEYPLELDLASPATWHRRSVGDGHAKPAREPRRAQNAEGRLAPALSHTPGSSR